LNNSISEKLFKILPGLNLVNTYKKEYLIKDLFAGLSVAAIVLPIGIAYAALIGLPPQAGLYSSILPMVAYALFGSSRQLILGPDAATCLLVASVIAPIAASNMEIYQTLSIMVAFTVGLLCILGGIFRLGSVANFLSKPILTGYLNGLAITIILGQLGKLFGFEVVSKEFFKMIFEFISKTDLTNVYTLLIGGGSFILILLLKKFYPRLPAPLIAVIAGILVISVFKDTKSITLVGFIPSGFPAFGIPKFEDVSISRLVYESSGIVLISFCSLMLTNKSFASRNGYTVDPNQDFIALGVADIVSGFSQGFVISGADSRTAVNNSSGGKTQLVSVFAAVAILICLLFFTDFLSILPVTVLSAIIISACIGLFDIKYLKKLFRLSKVEFFISMLTSVSVILIGVMPGVIIAVLFSMFRLIKNAAQPHISVQGVLENKSHFQNIQDNPEVKQIPGILVLKIESAMIFFNADFVKAGILQLISEQEEKVNCVIINGESINFLDVTAANTIENLINELSLQGIKLIFARANTRFMSMISEMDLLDNKPEEINFISVHNAVKFYKNSENNSSLI
jgi:high affinity sulfate transporter 1